MQEMREKMLQIFNAARVIDLPSLQEKLSNRSARSVFRDLHATGYFSSFTHAGKYYTLKKIPCFSSEGLWFHEEIGFARFGTLKNTLIKLIEHSDLGKTHDELSKQLHIRAHNTLLDLVRCNKIARKKIKDEFVYFSININRAKNQIQNREINTKEHKEIEHPNWIVIEILAAIIRIKQIAIDSKKIVSELKTRKVVLTFEQVETVLNQFNLKKIPDSKSLTF